MGPTAHPVEPDALRRRIASPGSPFRATASFVVSVYRPRGTVRGGTGQPVLAVLFRPHPPVVPAQRTVRRAYENHVNALTSTAGP